MLAMPIPAITLEVLPAGYGDCLLVSCQTGSRVWRMLVDTGPDETYTSLKARLTQLPLGADGKRHIDLFIVSHIDHDHIGGASLLLNDHSLNLSFGDIWFNAPPKPATRGVAEGESLANLLGARGVALPWNRAFSGKPVSTPAEGGGVELSGPGSPVITLLSPTPDRLGDLYKVWDKELKRLRRKERELPETERSASRGADPSVEELAVRSTATDHAVPNGSSIAVLLEHRGASALLAADAFPTVLGPALQALARRRGVSGPIKFDIFKLSHHGSRANVTTDLLDVVKADHYVFSTNGAIFNHPNDEAVARTILKGGPKSTLWFNYETGQNRRWATNSIRTRYGHEVRFPETAAAGLKLEILPRKVLQSVR